MFLKRLALLGVIFGVGLGTAGCTDGYGYSGVAVGYGGGAYGDGYGYSDPYGGYGYAGGYGYPSYFGWYGDYYYPGTGIYVYDQYRRPYRWNDTQRRYWEGRRNGYRGDRSVRNDWNGFDRSRGDGYHADRTQGAQGFRDGGNRAPGYRGGDGRPGRGDWRGNRQSLQAVPNAATPQSVTPNASQQQRSYGGDRAYRGVGNRGNGGWRGRR